jgi:hypothetical protein
VDGTWLLNDTHPKESDGSGNYNNLLTPEEIKEPVSTLSSAAPQSTTAFLAGAVPKESQKSEAEKSKSEESIPGAFPMTPPAETPGSEPQMFSINPLPATEGLGNPIRLTPGEPVPNPSSFTSNTIHSTVKDDKEPEEEKVSVAPIPATAGAGNPIHLAPGEKVPDASTFTTNTIQSTVNTDAASYEKSDALPPQLGPVVTPESERDAKGGMFSLPSLAGSLIPESSLPKDTDVKSERDPGFTIQSAAPTSSTAALAGQVPIEHRGVPQAVTESQQKAHFAPEAAANPEAVQEKSAVEQELKAMVPEEPPAAESTLSGKATTAATVGVTSAAGAFAAAYNSARNKAAETIGYGQSTQSPAVLDQAIASEVPDIVADSQKKAHVSPEASANSEAVEEKRAVESELLGKINQTEGASGPASTVPDIVAESQRGAHVSPEASANSEAVEEKKAVESELLEIANHTRGAGVPASTVPDVVAESQKEAHVDPEASANKEAVEEKKAVEAELLQQSHSTGNATAPVAAVPEVVVESQKQAHVGPEAAANKEAVEEKKEVEAELLQQVKKTVEAGEPAPTETAVTSATAPGLSDVALVDSKPLETSSESDGLNAGADKPAMAPMTAAQPTEFIQVSSPSDSRDVSPMSKAPTKAKPPRRAPLLLRASLPAPSLTRRRNEPPSSVSSRLSSARKTKARPAALSATMYIGNTCANATHLSEPNLIDLNGFFLCPYTSELILVYTTFIRPLMRCRE